MFKDQKNLIKVIPVTAGTAIDTEGYGSLTIALVGTTVGAVTPALTDCDTVDGTYKTVAAEYIIADKKSAIATAGEPYSIGYNGKHRYVKFALGADEQDDATIVAVLGNPKTAPIDVPADAEQHVL